MGLCPLHDDRHPSFLVDPDKNLFYCYGCGRGGDVIRSLAEVGPAVVLCSWTTTIGYGTLLYSLNRALRSFGWYAIVGEGTTLVTALVLLPALLILARPRGSAAPR